VSTQPDEAGAVESRPADLELARLRYRQACDRLTDRYPRVARDPQLASVMNSLEDALGAGPEAASPAAEASPGAGELRIPVTPDLVLLLDSSQCIVAEVTDGTTGRVLRRVTITDVARLSAAAAELLEEQRRCLADAGRHRRASGRLTQAEALEWLTGPRGWSGVPGTAAQAVADMQAGQESLPALAAADEGMTYDSTYWVIPAEQG
jgi:hypothetical protein